MKVFLVEDSQVVIERLEDLLEELPGIQVVGNASDVLEATKSILELRPDAVVLDLQLHDGIGLDVLKAVKSIRPETVFLVCTNFPYPPYRDKCIREGASFFLDKSTDFEQIPDILCGLMKASSVSSLKR